MENSDNTPRRNNKRGPFYPDWTIAYLIHLGWSVSDFIVWVKTYVLERHDHSKEYLEPIDAATIRKALKRKPTPRNGGRPTRPSAQYNTSRQIELALFDLIGDINDRFERNIELPPLRHDMPPRESDLQDLEPND